MVRAVLKVVPVLLTVVVAGYALAGSGSATASHAVSEGASFERIATVALTLLLLAGLSRLHR
jgi:hypothetical protein